jgi:phage portal protein BeeE
MRNLVMFDDYALVYGLSEMALFQHSVNRFAPFRPRMTEMLYNSMYPKIIDVIKLD